MRRFLLLVPALACAWAIPAAPALAANCSSFASQLAAQNYYNAQAGDPDGLDADNDGWACESNPAPKASVPKGAAAPQPFAAPQSVPCVVPNVKRLTKAKAISALTKAGCKTGKITKPKRPKKGKTLKVKSQSPASGASLPNGTKINLKLG